MRRLFPVAVCFTLAGCPQSEDKSAAGSAATAPASAAAAATTAAAPEPPKARKLDPLPLTLELPAAATIEKADATSVFVTEGDGKLLIKPLDKSFAAAKKEACDPLVCTLVRWVKEDADVAVAEWGGMLPGFRAFRAVEVGGKKYLCQNVGDSAPSADAAEAIVARCSALKPSS